MTSKTDKTICTVEDCSEPRAKNASKCREHRNEAQRAWVRANPDKVKARAYSREYYEKNKEAMLSQMKAYRQRNPEQVAEGQRVWREANEGHTYLDNTGYVKYIGYEHPFANPSGVTPYHRIVLWEKLNGQDAYCHWGCGKFLSWEKHHPFDSDALCVDHVNNVKDDNRPENLVPSCHACNVGRENARRPDARKISGECHLDYCDKPAVVNADGEKVCRGHYAQHISGRPYAPLRFRHKNGELARQVELGFRTCSRCDTEKPVGEFYFRNGIPKGVCKVCETERIVSARAKRLGKNKPCAADDCTKPADIKGLCPNHYREEWDANRKVAN